MKKLISLLLILTILVSLTACGDPTPDNPPVGPPGDTIVIEDADLLAYSFNRIENADLSFNMNMSGIVSSTNTGAASSDIVACGSSDTVTITNNPNDSVWVDFFESDRDLLEIIRDDSRRLCDFILEKVTVVNKIVNEDGMNYLLQYEGEDDVLTVYSFWGGVDSDSLEKKEEEGAGGNPIKGEISTDPVKEAFAGKVRDLVRIQFYYDEDGDETVSYFNYGISYDDYMDAFTVNSMEVIYTPYKHYEIKNYTCQVNKTTLEKVAGSDFMNVTVADRSTGKWQGMSWDGSSSYPYFTKEGNYDVDNNVSIGFVFETDEGLMQFNGKLAAYRDGHQINNGECLATDEIRLITDQQTSELFWLGIGDRCFTFTLSLANIGGWDKVVLDPSDEEDPYHCSLRGNDYIEFSNGKRLYGSETNSTVWIDGVGFVFIRYKDGGDFELEYIDENGVAHDSEWFISVGGEDYSKMIQFNGETYIDQETNTASTFFLNADIITSVDNEVPVSEDPFGLMEKFFVEMGLASKLQPDTEKTFAAIKSVYDNRTQYMDALFLDWNGVTFNYDTFVEYIFDYFDGRAASIAKYNGFGTRHEAVHISMIPEMPEDFALIAISGGITGSVAVSENGFDFSALSVAVEKNILLGDQNQYGVAAVLVGKNTVELPGAFNVVGYDNADFTVTGKSGVALPGELSDGEYSLALYFGRKTESGFARLSELSLASVSSFSAFEKRVDVADGYYTYAYSVVSGALRLSVTFTDTLAPTITLKNLVPELDNLVMDFDSGARVSDLIANASAFDNRDGGIIITSQNVLLMNNADGTAVSATDTLVDGATYRITVKDSSDNEATVNLLVKFN